MSRETEPNKLETGTPIDHEYNRNGIGSDLVLLSSSPFPANKGFTYAGLCQVTIPSPPATAMQIKQKQPSEAKRCIHTDNTE